MKKSLLEEEEEDDPMILSKKSDVDFLEEEEGDLEVVAAEKSLGDLPELEEEERDSAILAGRKSLDDSSKDWEGEPMNINEDLSVQLAATFELRRSSHNPPKNKLDHNLVTVAMPMATKSKGKVTPWKILLL